MASSEIADDLETAQRAHEVIEILNGTLDSLANSGQFEIVTHRRLFYVAFGWWVGIARSSRAVSVLYNNGLRHEAGPIARTILQHTLVLQWLADIGDDALDALAECNSEDLRKLIDTAKLAHWELPGNVDSSPPPKPSEPHPLRTELENFADLCIAYQARQLYVPYRLLSMQIHPSASGALHYVDPESGHLLSNSRLQSYGSLIDTARCLIQASHVIGPLLKPDTIGAAAIRAEQVFGCELALWVRRQEPRTRSRRAPNQEPN